MMNDGSLLNRIRERNPLIHNITNYVTVNDCANAVLAIGASPIMADDILEVEEIVEISSALVINIGTLNQRAIDSMIKACKKANQLHIPIILDPVGAGASSLRNKTVQDLLSQIKVDVIRGNLSEISFLAGLSVSTRGVDTAEIDEKNNAVDIGNLVAKKYSCVVGITGKIDTISDGARIVRISNGSSLLSKVTGTGCMTSALVGSFCGVTEDYFTATVVGIATMGIAGEMAFKKAGSIGTGSFRSSIIDALSNMNSPIFIERAKIHETQD